MSVLACFRNLEKDLVLSSDSDSEDEQVGGHLSCQVQWWITHGGHLSLLVFVTNSCRNPQVGSQFERFFCAVVYISSVLR